MHRKYENGAAGVKVVIFGPKSLGRQKSTIFPIRRRQWHLNPFSPLKYVFWSFVRRRMFSSSKLCDCRLNRFLPLFSSHMCPCPGKAHHIFKLWIFFHSLNMTRPGKSHQSLHWDFSVCRAVAAPIDFYTIIPTSHTAHQVMIITIMIYNNIIK